MDLTSNWPAIQTELIQKSIEGVFEVRLHEKHSFHRSLSTNQNIVLQTMLIESSKIRDEEIDFNFSFPWSLSVNINLSTSPIEQWKFLFSLLDKHPNKDVYKQAATSLRSVLCLTQILPAYSLFLQGTALNHSFEEVVPSKFDAKFRVILLKSPAGTLFLEVNYLKSPDSIPKVSQVHVPSVHGNSTPPCIEWNAASLSVSSSGSDLQRPFSPMGNDVETNSPKVLPKYFTCYGGGEDVVCGKKERKSFEVSNVNRECSKIANGFEKIAKEIEEGEENEILLKEFYAMLYFGKLDDEEN